MPYEKRRKGMEWQVVKKGTNRVLGTHRSASKANRQIRALYARERKR